MAYTSTDLANVQAALVALANGSRPVQVSSGDKMIRYAEMTAAQLKALEGDIKAALAAAADTTSPVYRTFAKQGGRC